MRRLLPITFLLLVLLAAAAHAAPPRPRPYAGSGVLALKPDPGADRIALVLYREPGLLRLAETDASALPRLAGSAQEPLLSVSARRGGWTRVAYDDAGRKAWIEQARAWQYLTWRDFLPGRWVRILPGMKKGYYALREEPGEQGAEKGALGRDQVVRVLRVEDDWALIRTPAGWFRWRDGDGRLTISLQGLETLENR